LVERHPNVPGRHSIVGRAIQEQRTVQSADVLADPEYLPTETARTIGYRAILVTPLMREGQIIGTLGFFKLKPGPTSISSWSRLLPTAVIAIENTRLLNELRESLQQQTATADVLKVISRSAFDLQKALDTLVQSATRLCEAPDATIFLREGELYRVAARYGLSREFQEWVEKHPSGSN
jgi:hypothetical protein